MQPTPYSNLTAGHHREALGRDPERPAKFAGIEDLPKRVQVMPANVQLVKQYIERHCTPAL